MIQKGKVMDIKVKIVGSTIGGEGVSVLNGAKIYGNENGTVYNAPNINIPEDLDCDAVLNELKRNLAQVDQESVEYPGLKKLIEKSYTDRKKILFEFKRHLINFSEGILAGIIANQLH